MGKQVVECKNCNNVGESKLKGSTLISFVLVLCDDTWHYLHDLASGWNRCL